MGAQTQAWEGAQHSGIHSLRYNFWGLSLSSLSCRLADLSARTHRVQEASSVSSFMMSPGPERTDLGWNVGDYAQ